MSETIRVLLSEEEVDAKINEIAKIISEDYNGKQVHLLCVLKGGVFFTCETADHSGFDGFPVRLQLWFGYQIQRRSKDCQRFGSGD